jgi:transposase-like protein
VIKGQNQRKENTVIEAMLQDYAPKLEKLLPLAQKAYGLRTTDSPAHVASREYTNLLKEYYDNGGSLVAMAKELDVAYAGLRRRVFMIDAPMRDERTHSRIEPADFDKAVDRVKQAKKVSAEKYHEQLLAEYSSGVSLGKLAQALGISSSNPLYYGVQRARRRLTEQA